MIAVIFTQLPWLHLHWKHLHSTLNSTGVWVTRYTNRVQKSRKKIMMFDCLQKDSRECPWHYRVRLYSFCLLPSTISTIMIHGSHYMNSMKTCPSVTFYFMNNSFSDIDRKWILPNMIRVVNQSIHSKDESKRGFAFAFIFGVNWPIL